MREAGGRVPVQVGGWVEMDFSCHWKQDTWESEIAIAI